MAVSGRDAYFAYGDAKSRKSGEGARRTSLGVTCNVQGWEVVYWGARRPRGTTDDRRTYIVAALTYDRNKIGASRPT